MYNKLLFRIMNIKTLKIVNKIPGWLSLNEGLFLERIAKTTENLNGVIVEVGGFKGKSTIFLAQGKGKIYSIDPHTGIVEPKLRFPNTYKEFRKNLKMTNTLHKIVPVVKTSRVASKKWNKKIRLLFIDALHDEQSALFDFETWSQHLVDDGVVAMHDSFMKWCGSEKIALKKIVNSSEFYKIGVKGCMVYGIKGKGNILNKATKFIWQIYINAAIFLNRLQITVRNLPSAIKKLRIQTLRIHKIY